jgi:hypothetical protein
MRLVCKTFVLIGLLRLLLPALVYADMEGGVHPYQRESPNKKVPVCDDIRLQPRPSTLHSFGPPLPEKGPVP